MLFCLWCGGKLPQSRRNEYFFKLGESDSQGVEATLEKLKDISEVERALGKPDVEIALASDSGVSSQFVRQLCYSRRWEKLIVFINVLPSGNFTYAVSPKLKAVSSSSK